MKFQGRYFLYSRDEWLSRPATFIYDTCCSTPHNTQEQAMRCAIQGKQAVQHKHNRIAERAGRPRLPRFNIEVVKIY